MGNEQCALIPCDARRVLQHKNIGAIDQQLFQRDIAAKTT